jgi:ribosomal protein S18 acetylase RimI-like enzyme
MSENDWRLNGMTDLKPPLRMGRIEDAAAMAELVNYAGEGLPVYLWAKSAEPGETAWDVGRRRAERDEGAFSYRNAYVIEADGACAGCLIGYLQPKEPEPIDYASMPPMFVPMQELENLAPNTWYVNVLAVFPQYRRQGLGSKLLDLAEELAREAGMPGMSIIIDDANLGARRLYEGRGYRETASRPMVKETWENDGENWILLTKVLSD